MHSQDKKWFCTLFDQNYLIKGLAMYQSLALHSANMNLFILCMDEITYQILEQLNLEKATLIKRVDFEGPELLAVKADRSVAEYCWTCTPSIISYVMDKFPSIDYLTYLDADLLFFSNPQPIFDELRKSSVSIIEHRFSKGFEESIANGKYNVQWVGFKRDEEGLETLKWWKEKCLEWCFNRSDDGRFGDQKYLDNWPTQFKGVHEIRHLGAGVGPWNFASYSIEIINKQVFIDKLPLIFYHFHGYKMLEDGGFTAMPLVYMDSEIIPYAIYEPYRHALWNSVKWIRQLIPNFDEGILASPQRMESDKKKYETQATQKKAFKDRLISKFHRLISLS